MQSVSSRIWTRVTVSISYDDNHYTTHTYIYTFGVVVSEEFFLYTNKIIVKKIYLGT